MTKYAVISKDPKAFFLGRYSTRERAVKAASVSGGLSAWSIYKTEEEKTHCADFGRCNCQTEQDCERK